jgi:hypothetical protein
MEALINITFGLLFIELRNIVASSNSLSKAEMKLSALYSGAIDSLEKSEYQAAQFSKYFLDRESGR